MTGFKQKRIRDKLTLLVTASVLSATAATAVLARPVGTGARGHAPVHRGVGAPIYNQAPSSSPIFNPSTPYTAPVAPEVPVSPASPGSVFGNGPSGR
jgi:hypothetical protein